MLFIFLPEVADRRDNRVCSRAAESTERGFSQKLREFLEFLQISHLPLTVGDTVENVEHLRDSLSAGGTFTAGFVPQKGEKILCHVDHAGVLVHDNHTTRPHHGAMPGQFIKVHLCVHKVCGDASA